MSYEVLARKWRPRTFEDLVGQSHVVRPLVNALDNQRLHHAFLFTGTRGVGKTTIARILAKSLNCEQGVSSHPCGECAACQEVDTGRFVDLIEVDAASRTKVDDTRELLDNVQYAPTRGRYKVYLIDEVHMLSGHSFNALLKTLEEPPPHVKFLLATTDPQKLPVTILSRCLQFSLKRLDIEQIRSQLEKVLQAEGIHFEMPALELLARGADGSMRDGLSLLDQAIAFGDGQVDEAPVREMLGTIDQGVIERLLSALGRNDAASIMAAVTDVAEHNGNYASVLDSLALSLHQVALIQAGVQLTELTNADTAMLTDYAESMSPELIQLLYQIAIHGKRDLSLAPDPRSGLEMTLLRMLAFRPANSIATEGGVDGGIDKVTAKPVAPAVPAVTSAQQGAMSEPAQAAMPVPQESKPEPAQAIPEATAPVISVPDEITWPPDSEAWAQWLDAWSIGGLLGQLLANAAPEATEEEGVFQLVLSEQSTHLYNKEREKELNTLLTEKVGRPITLAFRIGAAVTETPAQRQMRMNDEAQLAANAAIESDPNVKALQDTFDAQLKPGSIRPRTH
ncbi:MAG: DNA polymerase III subunit gamma/tau [Proteobacteria bacterium]|nr:DNA polymerase III subunit gamma/tau [Pseudomonadota bacterium]